MAGEYLSNGKWYSANGKPAPIGFTPPSTPTVKATAKPLSATAAQTPPSSPINSEALGAAFQGRIAIDGGKLLTPAQQQANNSPLMTGNPQTGFHAVPRPNQQTAPPTAMSFNQTQQAPQQGSFPQLTANQINQEAQYHIDKERSDLQTAANKQSTALRDNAAYANKLLTDSRALSDFSRTQTADPFGNMGRRSFQEGLIGRQRSIDDTHLAAGLTNELNAVQSDLYNFDKLAPDKQRALINEATRIERQYGLEVGSLMGEFSGNKTLGGKSLDLQAQNQDFNQGMANKQFDYNVSRDVANDAYRDKVFDYQKATNEWSQAFQMGQYTDAKAQQIWENNFKDQSFNQSVKQAAQQLGLDYSRMSQQERQFATEQAFREKSFKAQQEQITFDNKLKAGETQFTKGLEAYKTTGQMPDYMGEFGIDVAAFKDPSIKEDVDALYEALSSQSLTPQDALKMIDDKVAIGSENKADGDKLKEVIYTLNPKLRPGYVKPKADTTTDLAPNVPSGEGALTYYLTKFWNSLK